MMSYGGGGYEYKAHLTTISLLDGGQFSFMLRPLHPLYPLDKRLGGPRPILGDEERRPNPFRELKSDPLALSVK